MAKHYQPRKSLLALAIITVLLVVGAYAAGDSKAPKLGLDLRGGTQVILAPVGDGGKPVTSDQLSQTVRIIRQRVDGFGVAESSVTTQGSGANAKIVVSIPGVTSSEVVDQLKNTAKLNFRQVLAVAPGTPASIEPTKPGKKPKPAPKVPASWLVPPIQTSNPNDPRFVKTFQALDCAKFGASKNGTTDNESQYLITCDKEQAAKYLLAPAELSGTDIQDASAGIPEQGAGGYEISLTLTTSGASKFAETTKRLAKEKEPMNQFGIVLDGIVMSAPRVNEAILGGKAVITGSFTAETSKILAQELKFGALPVTLKVDEKSQISPTLGNDQLHAALLAGMFGLLLVILYLVLYYRALGLVAVASLIFAAVLLYLSFILLGNQIGFTLTLAGTAGAIVAIGITADSFVVYFERLRDELREGKRLRSAVDHGWSR
ncbi:MAG: protein translocase subunit SecD, partial [Actinobacteria bacterium]|nr:protein translocase subunit SecD [Actinomycetota bacterium]